MVAFQLPQVIHILSLRISQATLENNVRHISVKRNYVPHVRLKQIWWPTGTWKDAQYYWLLEKCKSKLQRGITSHQSEWPTLKCLQIINSGEDADKKEPSYVVGVNVHWHSHSAEQYGGSFKKKIVIIWSSKSTPGHISQDNSNLKRYMCPSVHGNAVYSSQNVEAT